MNQFSPDRKDCAQRIDIDLTCVKMTAINMLKNSVPSEIAWMNTLTLEHWRRYQLNLVRVANVWLPTFTVLEAGHTNLVLRVQEALKNRKTMSAGELQLGFPFFFDEECKRFVTVSSYIEPFLRFAAVAMGFIVPSGVIPCVYRLSLFGHSHPYPVELSIVGEFCPSVSFLYPCGSVCGSISHLQSSVYAGFLFRCVSCSGIGSVGVGIYYFSCIPFAYDVSFGCFFPDTFHLSVCIISVVGGRY